MVAVLATQVGESFQSLSVILLLRAFAAGAVALTGIEAIATGFSTAGLVVGAASFAFARAVTRLRALICG